MSSRAKAEGGESLAQKFQQGSSPLRRHIGLAISRSVVVVATGCPRYIRTISWFNVKIVVSGPRSVMKSVG